jgi:SPP1 gp7 family putative phage head morphogenesis protein
MTTLDDTLLSHQVATIKHGVELGNSVEPYMRKMKAIIRKEVAGFDAERRTAKRLETLIKKLSAQLKIPADDWLAELESQLKEFAKYEANYQADVIGGFVKMDLVAPTVNQIWAAAMFEPLSLHNSPVDFIKLMDDWGSDEVARLTMAVKDGFAQGRTVRQIIKEVVGAGGLADVSERNAMAVAQTAVAHIASETRMETYNANDDVVIGYELIVTFDSRTSEICQAWPPHKVYKLDDAYKPKPPFHYRCRTTTIPTLSEEFDFLKEGATRASSGAKGGEPVGADLSYQQWLKRQPAWFQDKTLGPVRGDIFRNAGLSPEEFRKAANSDLGQPLTLQEMASRDKQVNEYMKKQYPQYID